MKELKFSSRQYSAKKIAKFLVMAGAAPKTTKKEGIRIGDRNVKHVWSGKYHVFWIPNYLDAEKVTKYARGYASGQLTDKSFGWDLRKTIVEQPFDTRQAQAPARDAQGNIIYETAVEKKEQIADIRAWAKERGATVERRYARSREEAEEFAKKGIPITIRSREELPEKVEINIRTPETILGERSERLARVAGKKIYEKAGPVEKSLLHLHTVLSTRGYEYGGAAIKEEVARRPYDPGAMAAKAAIDIILPKIETTEDVVVDNISQKIARHSRGEYTYTYDLPLAGRVEIDERIVDAINNPVVDIELMALGGAGVAKVAATKTGAKVLGSTAGKVLMTAGGVAYAGSSGYEVYTLREGGEHAKALGVAATRITGLGAGILGFKAQQAHILKYSIPKKVDVDLSKIRGISKTAKKGDVTVSRGKFEITEGKLKGLRGDTLAVTQKKDGGLIVKIPSQKVGGHKIKADTIIRHTQAGKTIKTGTGKVYTRISKEGRILIDTGRGKPVKGPLVGRHTDKTFMKEVTKIMKAGTDRTGRRHNFVIRKLEGMGIGKSAKKYNLYLVRKGNRMAFIESKSGLVNPRVAKIDWIDISKISPAKGSIHAFKPGFRGSFVKTVPKAGTAPSIKSIAVPPASVAVKVEPSLGARIVPVVNPVPTGIRIKHQPRSELKTLQKVTQEPMIIRRETTKPKGRTVMGQAGQAAVAIPRIERAIEKSRVKYVPVASSYHPITGQEVTGKQATALRQQLEPIIDRIAPQPIPVVPVQVGKIPPGFGLPSMVPFLRLGDAKVDLKRFKTGVIKNPVPDIEKVI